MVGWKVLKKNPGDISVALRGTTPVPQISWQDLVHGGHASFHMFIHVAVEHPHPDGVGNHVGGDELGRQQRKNVRAMSPNRNYVSMRVGCMDINRAAQSHDIPPHAFSTLH